MPRTLSSAATTEKNKQNGAVPLLVLEIQYGGLVGTKYYTDQDGAVFPVLVQSRVLEWGSIQSAAEPGRVGGYGSVTVKLADPDFALKSLFDAKAGIQNRLVFIHLWFAGTSWSDRVTIFGGYVSTPTTFEDAAGNWSLSLHGNEDFLNPTIGLPLSRGIFPELNCELCEGAIPIVYGDPCYRVPGCLIDGPGFSWLNQTLQITDDVLFIAVPATQAGFPEDTEITLAVGGDGYYERFVGGFYDSGNRRKFTIHSRGAIQAAGVIPGVEGIGGFNYILLPQSAFSHPEISRAGLPLFLTQSGQWYMLVMTQWKAVGDNIAVAVGNDFNLGDGDEVFKVSSYAQYPQYPAGTQVYQTGFARYVVNFLPSEGVDAVETVDGNQNWVTFNPAYYSVNLDDRDFNTALGRSSGDPGITTVTMSVTPAEMGVPDLKLYFTVRGCTADDSPSGSLLTGGPAIIEHLLTCPWLGNVPSSLLDSSSFTAAKASVTTPMAFAIRERKQINDLVGDLSQQAGCLLFWDGGKVVISPVSTSLSGSVMTLSSTNTFAGSTKIDVVDLHSLPTRNTGKFKMTCMSPEQQLIRESSTAIAEFGRRNEDIDLWAFQLPTSVALTCEFWLDYRLNMQRTVTVDVPLSALHLRPGDVVTLDLTTGSDGTLVDSLARVRSVSHALGDAVKGQGPKITLVLELFLFTLPVDTAVPSNNLCYQTIVKDALPPWGESGPWPPGLGWDGSSSSSSSSSTTEPPGSCDVCPSTEWLVTISGIGGSSRYGSCGVINGTWHLRFVNSSLYSCLWESFEHVSGAYVQLYYWRAPLNRFEIVLAIGGHYNATYRLSADSFNCDGSNVMTLIDSPPPDCSGHPSTITIDPI